MTLNTAPAHPHATLVAVYPALFFTKPHLQLYHTLVDRERSKFGDKAFFICPADDLMEQAIIDLDRLDLVLLIGLANCNAIFE